MTPPARRVGLVLPNFTLGGAERQAVQLALRLPALGWEPWLFMAEDHGPLGDVVARAGLRVVRLNAQFDRPKWSPGFWRNLAGVISHLAATATREQIPLLHSFLYWQNQIAVPARLWAGRGVRAVITGRRNTGEFKDKRPHYQAIENLANRYTDAVVCNSDRVRDDVLARERIDPARLHVIRNGVDADHFASALPAPLRDQYPELRDAEFIVGTVGNLKRQKRHDRFLEAIALARRTLPGLHGIIVGRDLGELPGLLALRHQLGLDNVVAMAGPCDDPAPILRALDVFALTSDHEGLPNVVLEAMAAGVAVITTPAGGVAEILQHRRDGLVLDAFTAEAVAEAIGVMLAQPERRRDMATTAQAIATAHFSLDAMAGQTAALYEQLLR